MSCLLTLALMAITAAYAANTPLGFSAQPTSLTLAYNDGPPASYAYNGNARTVQATLTISVTVTSGTYIAGVTPVPQWNVIVSGSAGVTFTDAQTASTSVQFTYSPTNQYSAAVSVNLPKDPGSYTITPTCGNAQSIADTAYVVQLTSLTVTGCTWFDGGDNNPNTNSYAVGIAATGNVATVQAVTNPVVPASELPTGWTITGGTAVDSLTQKVDLSQAGRTTITAICGSTTMQATIYVISVSGLSVSGAIAFNDGSNDAMMPAYMTPISSSGNVTITTTCQPSSAPPAALSAAGWTWNGGTAGADIFTRLVTETVSAPTPVTCSCGSSSATCKIYVYTVTFTHMPSIYAGKGTEAVHTGIVTIQAAVSGKGIPNVAIGLDFAQNIKDLTTIDTTLPPTYASSTVVTDTNGNASTTMTSGKAVLPTITPGKLYSISEAILTQNGNLITGSNASLVIDAPDISVDAFYTGTTDPVDDFYLFGDGIDLYGYIANGQITSHKITWKFRYFAHDPGNNAMSDNNYLFDGTVSNQYPNDTDNTLYGAIYDYSDATGYYAYYVSGTQLGWIYWYVEDEDVLSE